MKGLLQSMQHPLPEKIECFGLVQAAVVASMAGYLLDVRSVRREIDRREACGQWVAGKLGEGGAFAMRTPEEKARIAAAGSNNEVCLKLPSTEALCAVRNAFVFSLFSFLQQRGTIGATYGQLSHRHSHLSRL
jgi:hypothetical protein